MKSLRFARLLALFAGSMDFLTGAGLVLAPSTVLALMRVPVPEEAAMVFVRLVGAFVGALGSTYLLALLRNDPAALRSAFITTLPFRAAAGSFTLVAMGLGWLSWAWWSVPLTDIGLVAVQTWLLRAAFWNDERRT